MLRHGLIMIPTGLLLALIATARLTAQDGPPPYSSDLDATLRRAQEKNLPILLLFTAQRWSPASRHFATNVLSAESLRLLDRAAREHEQPPAHAWLVVLLDVSNQPAQAGKLEALGATYAVDRFPSALLLTPDGRPCRTLACSGTDVETFVRELEQGRVFVQAVQNLLGEAAPGLNRLAKNQPVDPEQTERFLGSLNGEVFQTLLSDGFALGYTDLLQAALALDSENRHGLGMRSATLLAQGALRDGRREEFERYAQTIRTWDDADRDGILRSLQVDHLKILVEHGAWTEAEAEALRLLEEQDLKALAPQVWFFAGLAAVQEGKPEVARARLERALALLPEGAWAEEARGLLRRMEFQAEQVPAAGTQTETQEQF